jgi:hypothetical protein
MPNPISEPFLRSLSPGELADQAGKLKAALAQIKDEAIRRELTRAEGNLFRLTLSPPGRQTRLDRARLAADKGADFLDPYLYEEDSWVTACTPTDRARRATSPPGRCNRRSPFPTAFIPLKGNHEEVFETRFSAIRQSEVAGAALRAGDFAFVWGGCRSADEGKNYVAAAEALKSAVPQAHFDFLASLTRR